MNPVQQKISCVYVTGVTDQPSSKRGSQPFKVSATRDLTTAAERDDITSAKATEKLDGTCCLVQEYRGQPWLWARHDRKPNKAGERKFAQYKKLKQKARETGTEPPAHITWNPAKDFKEVPPHWMPASKLEVRDGHVMPDSIGHTPGWVPVELTSRQHCWHLSAVSLTNGQALILRQDDEEGGTDMLIETQPLSELCGQTCELIGTNINGNPYGIGTKKCPIHLLVPHGSLTLTSPQPTDYDAMMTWFSSDLQEARVEGVVWHCANGQLHKLHRHHLNLPWPIPQPRLSQCKVRVDVELTSSEVDDDDDLSHKSQPQSGSLFSKLASVSGQIFSSITDVHKWLEGEGAETS